MGAYGGLCMGRRVLEILLRKGERRSICTGQKLISRYPQPKMAFYFLKPAVEPSNAKLMTVL